MLEGEDRVDYAKAMLNEAFSRLSQAIGNLRIRTNPDLPDDFKGTDMHDRRFLLAVTPILKRLHGDLDLIGWFGPRG